jgi:hypothetical protein
MSCVIILSSPYQYRFTFEVEVAAGCSSSLDQGNPAFHIGKTGTVIDAAKSVFVRQSHYRGTDLLIFD